MCTDTCVHARHIKQILVHTSLKLDMVLQGLWVLRVRQHIKVAVWIQTGNLRWYITQWNLAVMCHRVIVLHMKGRGMEKRKQERGGGERVHAGARAPDCGKTPEGGVGGWGGVRGG